MRRCSLKSPKEVKELMKQEQGSEDQRKPYLKPEVEQVELVAEEQVLGGCKNSTSVGPLEMSDCITDDCILDGT